MRHSPRVLLCVCGGIAAYKAASLCSRLHSRLSADVRVALTRNATRLVAPATFEALSGNPAMVDTFAPRVLPAAGSTSACHLSLAAFAQAVVVAPATANVIGKLANGIADDLVTTALLARRAGCPLVLCPAMNAAMWANPAVCANVARLREQLGADLVLVGPAEGRLADGSMGVGRLARVRDIVAAVKDCLERTGNSEASSSAKLRSTGAQPRAKL
eukprot:TRINITY_DN3033_c1_g1_i1.p2 TRINITY_DN3033_c1_g1~~TRINITY_DN3033_c1_g1_i1.p2  ORF type:complete len:216 (+),score=57.59 TRINITY_DN3033_c1_g1_i1:374-1021(+)